MRRIFAFIGSVLLLVSFARAGDKLRDLGPIPTNGATAAATVSDRSKRVITELACGSEANFINESRWKPEDRPVHIVVAKAAVLAGMLNQNLECRITQIFDLWEWDASIKLMIDRHTQTQFIAGVPITLVGNGFEQFKTGIINLDNELDSESPPTAAAANARATENADAIRNWLSALERDLFPPCAEAIANVTFRVLSKSGGQRGIVEYRISFVLNAECLEAQINALMLAKDLHRNGHNPGTDGLPCGLAFKAPPGDWDMAVSNFTRLTFLLRQAATLRTMSADTAKTRLKLHERLLSLSGEPAREVHPIWACGNPDNKQGSARGRLDDQDFYDPDLGKTVSGDEGDGDSFWKDFAGAFLLALALLLLGMLLAAVMALIAALFGAVIAAMVFIALMALAAVENVPAMIAGLIDGGIEETENHLFMQNSGKYLMNKMLMEEADSLGDLNAVAKYQQFNANLHSWFMARLRRVAMEDFLEFNAKPYTHHSYKALLNIHNFSCQAGVPSNMPICAPPDVRLIRGTAGVFDLTAAKFALGSSQGRRIVPFRRLSQSNTSYSIGPLDKGVRKAPYQLHDAEQKADHWISGFQLWTGMTFHAPSGHAHDKTLGEMILESTSSYTPHAMILDLAIDKSTPIRQTFHHAGWERYSSGPGWLLTAGGTESGYAQGFRTPFGTLYPTMFIKFADRGAGVPTTLMASSGRRVFQIPCGIGLPCPPPPLPPARVDQPLRQDAFSEFIRFEGKVVHWEVDDEDEPKSYNDNFCVSGSFACGINMQIPKWVVDQKCRKSLPGIMPTTTRMFEVIDSADCPGWADNNPANDFYVVIYQRSCKSNPDCADNATWGFIEVVEKGAFADVAALQASVLAKNGINFDAMSDSGGTGEFTYDSMANGVIKFSPSGSFVANDNPANWPRAAGNVVNRIAPARFTITNPRTGQMITVDFSNPGNPLRVLPP